MTNTEQNDDKLKVLVEDIFKFGDLLLIANKGIGKTNSLMVLARAFREQPNTRTIIFEDFPKFALEFDSIPYIVIHDDDVTETSHTVDLEDYFLRHERDYTVKRGSEIEQALEQNKDLIFTSEITDIERQAFFIYSVIQYFYRKNYRAKWRGYHNSKVVFIIEESQNVFDSSTISKKIFNRLRKIFSVARNLDIHFILASQRIQDLNTKIRGRTRLLIGQVSLDDYELKIRRLLRHSQHREAILTLERGKFLYTALDIIVSFPKFQQIGKPYEWHSKKAIEQPQQPKKQGFLTRLKYALFPDLRRIDLIKKSAIDKLKAETQKINSETNSEENEDWLTSADNPDSENPDSESEIEIDESEEYPEEW